MKILKSLAILSALLFTAASSQATLCVYTVNLSDIPPNISGGVGDGTFTLNDVTFEMISDVHFSLVSGIMTGAMLFGPTAIPYTGTASTAVGSPFTSFTNNSSIGRFTGTLDMTQAGNYDPSFLAANGGNTAAAFAALKAAANSGKTYIDIKTTAYPGGAIRGFLTPVPEPTSACLLAIGAGMGLMRRRRNPTQSI